MSVHEKPDGSGFIVRRQDGYGKKTYASVASRAIAEAIDARLEQESRATRTALRNFRNSVGITLGEAIDQYLRSRGHLHRRTRATETARFANLWRELGNKPLEQITPGAISDYFAGRKLVLAPWSLYREACMLHKMFAAFKKWWFIPANPVELVKVRVPHETRRRALSYDETRQLLEAASNRVIVRFLLAHDAGLAMQEMANLRRRHIDLAEKMIEVLPIKGRAHRAVPM
ncbi:MAG: hypothetical protein HY508_06640, partial [Acidobacteria bacterium]|nr:hypothetical protein [Acidobacteriota bacterium]